MSLTISSNYNLVGGLFSSSSSSSSSSTGIESLLSDYYGLKSGSTSKLLKAYYSTSDSGSSTSKASTTEKSQLSATKSDSEALTDATDKLLDKSSSSIWKKVETTDEDGNTSTDYDRDAIYSAVSSFIDSYNDLVDSGQDSSNTGVLTQVASMVTTSSSSLSTLAQVGITIGSDNHLSIDEDYFKNNADMTVAKSLFNGTGSYAYQIATKASMVNSYSTTALADITGSKLYSSDGSYNISTSDLLSSFNTTT